MQECQIGIFPCECGSFLLDVRPVGATGSKPILNFKSWPFLIKYFEQMQLSRSLIDEIAAVGKHLGKGTAFYQRMFLPEEIEECLIKPGADRRD